MQRQSALGLAAWCLIDFVDVLTDALDDFENALKRAGKCSYGGRNAVLLLSLATTVFHQAKQS